jgi:threonine dehydratase
VIDLDDVRRAQARLDGVTAVTPVIRSDALDVRLDAKVFVKPESLQRCGSFKLRGAYNKVASLRSGQRARGLATVSSGNHAQAVALAGRLHDTHVVALMPHDSPAPKLAGTRALGADVIGFDRYLEDRAQLLAKLVHSRGMTAVHPYDDPAVIAGQGTVALELLDDAGELDALVVSVGGGGLIAGCATVAEALCGNALVVGVEPEFGDDTRRSLEQGKRVRIPVPRTIADGQQAVIPGELTFPINRRLIDRIALVSDAEIAEAMAFGFAHLRLVIEPSGACALAALLAGKVNVQGMRVGLVISGGNVSPAGFHEILARYANHGS